MTRQKNHMRQAIVRPCERCLNETIMYRPSSKYCRPCAAIADADRKASWVAKQPRQQRPLSELEIAKRRKREEARREKGVLVNMQHNEELRQASRNGISERCPIVVQIPFDYGLSKNAAWTMARGSNYVYMKDRHRSIRQKIAASISEAKPVLFSGKVWLDILIQKTSHQGDAINMLDGIADAVKSSIGIDDNWFCIRQLDWQIVKDNPMIVIGISQDVREHHQVCSYCGMILPLEHFGKRKHGPMGHARVCKSCCRADDAVRRKERTEMR